MSQPLRVGIAGLGRMGQIHALHLKELSDAGACAFAAAADIDTNRGNHVLEQLNVDVPLFASVAELAASRVCDAVVVVTPTDQHSGNAEVLIERGHRILLEKPLTGTLESDRKFASVLDRNAPDALMLAFQRRFDPALQYAKQLADEGMVGRVFKVYSALEDSNPAPDGYRSGGILPDMSVHNVDEILWLTGWNLRASLAIGSRLYSYAHTSSDEDFDDALLYVWFEENTVAQIQVSRNHVSGYRVETILFGEKGQIHIGRFDGRPLEVVVEAYGVRGTREPLARQTFSMRDYARPLPEFVDRFGSAYKAELAAFIECCRANAPFPANHRDGVRAQEIIAAGMSSLLTQDHPLIANTAAARTTL